MLIIPDINPRLQAVIDVFNGAGCPLSAAEIVWLAKLREPCDNPPDGGLAWPPGAVLAIGEVNFWPLHQLAVAWWQRADELFKNHPAKRLKIYAFAHCRSCPGDGSLRAINTIAQIDDAIMKWWGNIPLHIAQLPDINMRLSELDGTHQDAFFDLSDEETSETCSMKLMSGVSGLMQTFPGTTHEYWLTGISMAELHALTNDSNPDGFATSEPRRQAMERFLTAVKWLKVQKGLRDE